jgi:hypothetical protein
MSCLVPAKISAFTGPLGSVPRKRLARLVPKQYRLKCPTFYSNPFARRWKESHPLGLPRNGIMSDWNRLYSSTTLKPGFVTYRLDFCWVRDTIDFLNRILNVIFQSRRSKGRAGRSY